MYFKDAYPSQSSGAHFDSPDKGNRDLMIKKTGDKKIGKKKTSAEAN